MHTVGTTCEHLGFCLALKVPTFVVVSKIDLCTPDQIRVVERQLHDILSSPGCNKISMIVKSDRDVYNAAQRFGESK